MNVPAIVLRVVLARSMTTLGRQMLSVAVGYELYARTRSALTLGLVGLMQIIPVIVMFIPAGALVDRRDRRNLALGSALLLATVGLLLAAVSWRAAPVPLYYALLLGLGLVSAVHAPASSALIPTIIPRQALPRANAFASTGHELAMIIGPGLAGALLAVVAPAVVYAVVAAAGLVAAVAYGLLPRPPRAAGSSSASRSDWRVGLRFIFRSKLLLPALTLDLFAVLFAGAVALMPIVAIDVLHAGPVALGILRAAPAAGALLMALAQTRLPPWQRPGRVLLTVVAAYAVTTIGFGLSRSLPLSVALLALGGALDNVSAVIRMTLEQMATPDDIRGRVSAVHHVFIGMSNELGELESGLAAFLVGVVPTIVGGGALALVVVGLVAWRWPGLATLGPLASIRPDPSPGPGAAPPT